MDTTGWKEDIWKPVLGRTRIPVFIFQTICDTPPKTPPLLWDTCQPHLHLFSAIATVFPHFLMLNYVSSDQTFTPVFELSLLSLPFQLLASWSSFLWFTLKQKGVSVRTQTLPFLFLFKLGTWSSRFLAFCRERICSDEVDGVALLSLREPVRPGGHWSRGGGICKQFIKCYNRQRPLFHSIYDQKSKDISFSPNNLWQQDCYTPWVYGLLKKGSHSSQVTQLKCSKQA